MGKIDTSGWKEFRVGDLFDIHPTKAYKCTNAELLDGGGTNVVVNSAYDNGIGGTSTFSPTENGNMITFSDTVDANTIFYQKSPFVGYPHVQGLYPVGKYQNAWTQESLQYFVTAFRERALAVGFDYGNKFRRDIAANLFVKLPSTPDGDPDWAYMESYMADLEAKVAESLTLLQAAKDAEKKKVDTREWGEFRVGELFDIKRPAARSEKKYCEGEINYVSSGAFNNGVANKLMPLPNELLDRGGCITVSPLDGSSFYQEEDFLGRGGSGASISILYNSHLNRNNALFICSVIRSSANGFGYTDLLNGENLKSLTIKLPMDKTGQPDWGYMEEYMRKVEERVKATMGKLEKKCYVS
jgi:hypothetical protein